MRRRPCIDINPIVHNHEKRDARFVFPLGSSRINTKTAPKALPHSRYGSIDAELNELFDWQLKTRQTGFLLAACFIGLNLMVWALGLMTGTAFSFFIMLSAALCFGGYMLYRLHYHLERLVVHTLVIRKELMDLQESIDEPKQAFNDSQIRPISKLQANSR